MQMWRLKSFNFRSALSWTYPAGNRQLPRNQRSRSTLVVRCGPTAFGFLSAGKFHIAAPDARNSLIVAATSQLYQTCMDVARKQGRGFRVYVMIHLSPGIRLRGREM